MEIGITYPATLVDTGATRCCLSGAQYQEMGQPPFTALCKGTVWATTRGDMQPLGFLECSVKIQERVYQHEFIVCQNMVLAVILGIDFARSHKSRAAVNYTLICVEPDRPTQGVWPIAAVTNDSQSHLVTSSI